MKLSILQIGVPTILPWGDARAKQPSKSLGAATHHWCTLLYCTSGKWEANAGTRFPFSPLYFASKPQWRTEPQLLWRGASHLNGARPETWLSCILAQHLLPLFITQPAFA